RSHLRTAQTPRHSSTTEPRSSRPPTTKPPRTGRPPAPVHPRSSRLSPPSRLLSFCPGPAPDLISYVAAQHSSHAPPVPLIYYILSLFRAAHLSNICCIATLAQRDGRRFDPSAMAV